jgi:hypothetical protein
LKVTAFQLTNSFCCPINRFVPLKTHKVQPPGGLVYEQRDNDGNVIKKFRSDTAPMSLFCRDILKMRVANGYARATPAETVADVDESQCERLKNDPQWCNGGVWIPPIPIERVARHCGGCGLLLNQ